MEHTITTTIPSDIKLYSVKEVAALLSISKNRVYDLIYSKRLPAMNIGGFKVRHEALANFLKEAEGLTIDFLNLTKDTIYPIKQTERSN